MTARGKASAGRTSAGAGSPQTLTRRGFVTLVAAGSAALLARPGLAEEVAPARKKGTSAPATAKPAPPEPPAPPPSAAEKEFERQRAGTLSTLKTLREYPLPPGGDLPVVFRPQRARKRGH
jgi:hypothetical protein